MPKSGKQTEKGKAFEYACAQAVLNSATGVVEVELQESAQLASAERFFSYLNNIERANYIKGATAAIKIIKRLEPRLFDGTGTLIIGLQADSQGIAGDVRDVICERGEWMIGLSCKHNHAAVKHSRLSATIDFGKEWFGKKCSQTYFKEVNAVFGRLKEIMDESRAMNPNKPALWSDLPDKEQMCYVPVLKAFIKELKRLDAEFPREIPEKLIRYLIGRNDFYKVIMNENRRFTQIESININGTLSQSSGKRKALIDAPLMKLPTKFYEIGFKEGSNNTILVVCDEGWNVSMRIHNASSKIETSLKFDVQLIAMPSSILTQIEPWEE